MKPTLLALCLAALSGASLAGSVTETPSTLIGSFRSTPHRICLADAGGGKSWCSRVADTMRIERTPFGGARDVKVTAEFNTAQAQVCAFEGMGVWNSHARVLSVSDPRTGCELSLAPQGSQLRAMVARPDQCNSPCAGRSWVEGVVMRKRQ
ncbi:MAG: hypothetical protein V4669_15750 [Pseudomonadota bacterium]